MQSGSKSLLNGRNLIMNASFPRAVLPLVSIVKAVFDFMPTVLVYFAFHAVLGQPFGLSLIVLPRRHHPVDALEHRSRRSCSRRSWCSSAIPADSCRTSPDLALRHPGAVLRAARSRPAVAVTCGSNPLYPAFAALEQIFNAQFPSPAYLLGVVGVGGGLLPAGCGRVPGPGAGLCCPPLIVRRPWWSTTSGSASARRARRTRR